MHNLNGLPTVPLHDYCWRLLNYFIKIYNIELHLFDFDLFNILIYLICLSDVAQFVLATTMTSRHIHMHLGKVIIEEIKKNNLNQGKFKHNIKLDNNKQKH